jgi:hypothetical protein
VSDPRITGPLSAILVPVGDELHRPKSPFEQAFASASFGAFLLTLCIYAAIGHTASEYSPTVLWIWAGCTGFSALLVWVGLRSRARAPRDIVRAFFSIAGPAGTGWALSALAGPEVFDNYFVHGFFLAWAVGGLVECFLSIRGVSGDAQRNVRRHIEQNRNVWRSGRRR